jgi:hypothetical protein
MPLERTPDVLPVLSRGKHRSPKRGACFMEMASYLAGERWSDAPACTHPLLAAVARAVNDGTTDAGRSAIAPLVPTVIGLTTDDPRLDAELALVCARAALPVAAFERQRALAVGVLNAERALAELDGRPVGDLSPQSRVALAGAPDAERWARGFAGRAGRGLSVRAFRRHAAPSIVSLAVRGLAAACVADTDDRLRQVLLAAIAATERRVAAPAAEPDPVRWSQACALTS